MQTLYNPNGWQPYTSYIPVTQSVVYLNLSNTNIGDEAAKRIADGLLTGRMACDAVGHSSIREFRVIRRSSPGLARVSCYSFWAILFHQESRSTVSNYLIGSIFVDKQEPNFASDVKHIFNILYEFGKARTFVHLSSLNRISLSFCLT